MVADPRGARDERDAFACRPRVGVALVTDSGDVVFSAEGRDARRLCLRRAYESGVLRLR